MLFILVKNELIKLLRRGKTWIVFALFVALVGLTIFSSYKMDQNERAWRTPENQLSSAKNQLEYTNEEIANNAKNPEYIEMLQNDKVNLEERIKILEETIKTGADENLWKTQLDQSIASTKDMIAEYERYDEEWSANAKLQAEQDLEMYEYLKENNIKPLEGWEYDAYGYIKMLFQFLGMAILVSGIAVFMSDIVSGECTPPTLKFLLIQPVTRGKVLLSKFIAVTLTVLSMILGAELLGFTFVNLTSNILSTRYPVMIGTLYESKIGSDGFAEIVKVAGSGHMGTNGELLFKAMLLQALFIITTCAVVFLISTLIKSSMITMSISVMVTVFLTIGSFTISILKKVAHLIFLNYANTFDILTGGVVFNFGNANMSVTYGIIVMIITTIAAYTIAHINFNKKDILI